MKGTKFKSEAAYLALLSQLIGFGVPGATIHSGRTVSLGVGRLGEISGPRQKAYSILESQVRRWLENTGNESVRFQTVEASAPISEINRMWIETTADLAWEAALEGHRPQSQALASDKWAELEARLKSPGLVGSPSVQKGWVALAARAWKTGQKDQARFFLKHAATVHPEAKIEFRASWPDDPTHDWNAFEEEATLQTRSLRPLCQVRVPSRTGPAHDLSVNGFPVNGETLNLPVGRFTVAREGANPALATFRCERAGRYQVSLAPAPAAPLGALGGVTAGTLFLIEPHGEEFRFYLFTQGVGVDEVPVNGPISVSGLLAQSQTRAVEIPVSSDAFLELFQKHRAALEPMSLASNSYSETSALSLSKGESETPWFKSWTFWTVIGAVAITAVAVGVGTAGGGVESSPRGIKLSFE